MIAPITTSTVNMQRTLPWGPRRAGMTAVLKQHSTDLLQLTECKEYERDLIRDLPAGYFQAADHVNTVVLARSALFEAVGEEFAFETQGYGRKRYGCGRLLRRKADGFTFFAATWHPSNTGEYPGSGASRLARAEAGRMAQGREFIAQLKRTGHYPKYPLLLLGDFNDSNWAPRGLTGILVAEGLTDMLRAAGMDVSIDRGFTRGFKVTSGRLWTFSKRLSDHGQGLTWSVAPIVTPPAPKYLGPYELLTNIWAVQHNPGNANKTKPKDGTKKPYGKTGYRPKGYRLTNVVKLVQARDSEGKEHTYAVTATGNRYAMGDSPNKTNWVRDLSK